MSHHIYDSHTCAIMSQSSHFCHINVIFVVYIYIYIYATDTLVSQLGGKKICRSASKKLNHLSPGLGHFKFLRRAI